MEMLIIFTILILLLIFLSIKFDDYAEFFIGFIVIFILLLILHVLHWSLSSYNYNIFVTKRNAFIETLNYARENESKFELASITHEVSEWNKDLAEMKYDNNVFLLKTYIDDRVDNLKPIR